MNARDDRRHISCCGQGKQGIQGVAGRTPGWPPPWPSTLERRASLPSAALGGYTLLYSCGDVRLARLLRCPRYRNPE